MQSKDGRRRIAWVMVGSDVQVELNERREVKDNQGEDQNSRNSQIYCTVPCAHATSRSSMAFGGDETKSHNTTMRKGVNPYSPNRRTSETLCGGEYADQQRDVRSMLHIR